MHGETLEIILPHLDAVGGVGVDTYHVAVPFRPI